MNKITPAPWTLHAGRTIETPSGTFSLTYGREEGSNAPRFRDPCELDTIARHVAVLPELVAALRQIAQHTVSGRPSFAAEVALAALSRVQS